MPLNYYNKFSPRCQKEGCEEQAYTMEILRKGKVHYLLDRVGPRPGYKYTRQVYHNDVVFSRFCYFHHKKDLGLFDKQPRSASYKGKVPLFELELASTGFFS